eukprot:GHVT01099642.1.p1 GENE.GHVT01099642.1~~GHVT01099642.1.p1  ORF type:complete len:175 (+),score=34.39 GHVT01099642.1:458-982(+)
MLLPSGSRSSVPAAFPAPSSLLLGSMGDGLNPLAHCTLPRTGEAWPWLSAAPSEDSLARLSTHLTSSPPCAVGRLLSDMKMLKAYEAAADWHEPKAAEVAFDNFSWDDPHVLSSLPRYLSSRGEQRNRVDYAFNVIHPQPVDPKDVKKGVMTLWLKARLFFYDQQHPFKFNPFE